LENAVTVRPIPLKAYEVRAVLDGRKTQDRRVLKLPTKTRNGPIYEHPELGGWAPTTIGGDGCFAIGRSGEKVAIPEQVAIWHQTCGTCLTAPYQVGDWLWVRETWGTDDSAQDSCPPSQLGNFERVGLLYRATDKCTFTRWRPSIHMPRWASRLTLEVTGVRVERLQEISDEDAEAEGICTATGAEIVEAGGKPGDAYLSAFEAFADLWDSLNAKRAPWDSNPWVVVIEFTPHWVNVERMER